MKMHTVHRISSPAFVLTLFVSGLALPVHAAPKRAPEWFTPAETWQETVRVSREALAAKSSEEIEVNVPGTPAGVRWSGWHAIGPFSRPADNDGWDHAYPPEAEIDPGKKYGKLAWKRETRADGLWHGDIDLPDHSSIYMFRTVTSRKEGALSVYVGCDDRFKVWLNGKLVASETGVPRDKEVKLPLKAGENRLLLKLYNVSGGKGYGFSLTRNTRNAPGKKRGPEDQLWTLVEKRFGDAQDRRQMQWERQDGIWSGDWKPGDFADLAGRYAMATREQGTLQTEAGKLAPGARNTGDLRAVRDLYYQSRRIDEAVQAAGELDTAPLRRAIEDLASSFGRKYPKGDQFLKQLAALEKAREPVLEAGGKNTDKLVRWTEEFQALRNEALFANPLLDFDELLVIKRRGDLALPQNWQGNCVKKGGIDNEIAVLSPVRLEGELSTLYRPESNRFVGDVDLHWDAERMLFSMPSKDNGNRYEIFEINADGSGLRQVTRSEPDVDNYDACYLPNEKIIYGSTACFQGVPCVGGGNQVANLYLMNPDGTGTRRLCFDQDHNWYPAVMNNGRVMFARWEYSDTPHYFTRIVMSMRPDGTDQRAIYGSNSYWPNSTFYTRAVPQSQSQFVGVVSGHHGVARMGELILFDLNRGEREADGVVQRIPGYGEKVEPIIQDRLVDKSWPRFLHPYPLSDKYILTACQPKPDAPWGIYLVDVFDNIVPVCVEPGVAMLEPVPLRKTKRPPVIPEAVDLERDDATVHISDIHVGGGLKGVERGAAKKLRLFAFDYGYQGLANHTYIGMEGPWDVHRILGTVDIEKDGSSSFRIPANTPIAIQPLDEDGKALQLMRSWLVAMPGENLSCIGCHESNREAPPTRVAIANKKAPQKIQPWFGPARGFSFDREVQPVLDRHCIGCHNDKPHDGKQLADLRQDNVQTFSRAYKELQQHVRRPGPESDYHMFPPGEYHADTSPLIQMLQKGHHGVKLDREAWERLFTWIDLNVPYYGTWGEFRTIPRGQRERRAELRELHAGVTEDYEVIPDLATAVLEPLIPEPPKRAGLGAIECPDWPFDQNEARERQGTEADRTFTVELDDGKKLEIPMVRIPAGEFVMGDAAGADDEYPPCRVKIDKPFWISKKILTNADYALFDPEHDSRYLDLRGKDHSRRGNPMNKPEQPVVRVPWARAMDFCKWLSEKSGQRVALPTEAQWEFACRAGAVAGQAGNGRVWGIDGMPGSTAEWTRSTYRPYPYMPGDGRDDGARKGLKVVRGDKGLNVPDSRRDTYRQSYQWWQGVWNVGFRIVCLDDDPGLASVEP